MEISVSKPMPDDRNCQVIEALEARPLRGRRGRSAEAKARLVEETLQPGSPAIRSILARKGPDGLAALVRDAGSDPFNRFAIRVPGERIESRLFGGMDPGSVFTRNDSRNRSFVGRG